MEKEMELDRLKQAKVNYLTVYFLSEEAEPTQQVATLKLRVMEMKRSLLEQLT